MTLKLYNTRTKAKDLFQPLDPKNVRMYVCGPTVYDNIHIGNARPLIVFDVLFRLLRHLAKEGKFDDGKGETRVTYVRNITDVDDKINARALERYPDLPPRDAIAKLTTETIAQFHADAAALGCLMPEDVNELGKPPSIIEPRATDYIEQMKAMIIELYEADIAYVAEDHVLFSVAAYDKLKTVPRYGSLAKRSLDEMIAGARVEVAPYKRDAVDFVLWKPSAEGEPGWPSPLNIATPGRPGWHLECSAMSRALLGPEFDIHGGGIDLVFPHHENEVAQSCAANKTARMANVWMHNGFLQVEGKKMSKSDGNFITVREVFDGWGGRFWPTVVVRLAMLMGHYRQPIDWTSNRLEQAAVSLSTFGHFARNAQGLDPCQEFMSALSDDLNTSAAITCLHRLAEQAKLGSYDAAQKLAASCGILGLEVLDFDIVQIKSSKQERVERDLNHDRFNSLLAARAEARKAKNWAEADRIRDELAAMGITLKDQKDPETGEIVTTWEVSR